METRLAVCDGVTLPSWAAPPLLKIMVVRAFETISFHRTLTEYSEALNDNGLVIKRLLEPKPTEAGMEKLPYLKTCLRIPHSLAFETVKL